MEPREPCRARFDSVRFADRVADVIPAARAVAPPGSTPAARLGSTVVTSTLSEQSYTARHLSVLEGLEAVRKRPGMYIGTTDSRGLMHCVWEIVDNAVDEALGGHCTRIEVVLHADGSVEVRDDGRGIPVDIEPKTGLTGVEVVFTKLHAGGKFGGGSYAASGGLHGVGASVVNALSARLDVEVDRGGKTYRMTFHRGEPGTFADGSRGPDPESPFSPFVDHSELAVIGKVGPEGDGHADPLLAGPAGVPQDGDVRRRGPVRPGAPDVLPGAGPDPRGARRAPSPGHARRGRAARRGVRPPRRRGGLRRLPRARRPDHRHLAAVRLGHVHRDRPDARLARPPGVHRGRARVRGRCRAALGHRVRDRGAQLRQHHRHAQGRHAPGRLRAGPGQDAAQAGGEQRPPAEGLDQGLQRADRQGRHHGGPDRRAHRPARRAAVRGPDQGGARHRPGAPGGRQGRRDRAHRAAHLDQARPEDPVRARAGQGRRRDARPAVRAQAEGDLPAQERPGDLGAARQARRLPQRRRRPLRAVHRRGRQRAGHREARPVLGLPGPAADPRQDPQRPEGLDLRHAPQRRVRGDHPGDRRRVGAHVRPRGGALRQDRADDRRRRGRRAHPHPAAHAVLPLHAPDGRRGPRLRRRAAAAPRRGDRQRQGEERVPLHLLRDRARPDPQAPGPVGQALQGRHPALQGPGGDGRRPARRDHHGPARTAPCGG